MATSFVALKFAQKLVVGGILGTCGTLFYLNGASSYERKRQLRDHVTETARSRTEGYHTRDGWLVPSQSPQKPQPPSGLASFLKNVWTPRFIHEHLILNRNNLEEGRWYTLLTSTLTHFTPAHLLMNMLTFWSMAPPLISAAGIPAFLTIWIVSGMTGGVASIVRTNNRLKTALSQPSTHEKRQEIAGLSDTNFAGASGSIFGLAAAGAVIFPELKLGLLFVPFYFSARMVIGCSFLISVIADLEGWLPSVGHWGHAGGMIAGATIGYGLKRARLVRYPTMAMATLFTWSISRKLSIQQ